MNDIPQEKSIANGCYLQRIAMHIPLCILVCGGAFYSFALFANQRKSTSKTAKATFAGGCFWCMEPTFDHLEGVISCKVGYLGGDRPNPTYEEVCTGGTGHLEVIEIVYDPSVISYRRLLDIYWRNIDPTDKEGQFCDVGNQYRTAIFYHDEMQKKEALAYRDEITKMGQISPIEVQILPAKVFYPAEDYHQEYYKKNPARYKFYRYNCGRDRRLREIWGDSPEHRH